jgi:asparagine N-glycosylation enzyme membrane subunit Stt3
MEEQKLEEKKIEKIGSEEEIIRIRKEKVIKFFTNSYNWIVYAILAVIVFVTVKIRTSNIPGLKDVTTGTWTLGPDLDPFFFLRLAKYIVEHGKLMVIDTMRYVPLGFKMSNEYTWHPYMIAWFHKIAAHFGSESVTYSAIIYPVFMFGLTVIAFFFMTRKMFLESLGEKNASVIALIASFFLSVIPALLPRTIAGIPEKESAAFLFLFLSFYLFLCAWDSKNKYGKFVYAILAGMSTTVMANIWGGYVFIFLTIAPAVFIAFLLGKVNKEKFYIYTAWLISAFVFMSLSKYNFKDLVRSTASGAVVIVFFIIVVHFIIYGTNLKRYLKSEKLSKIPPRVLSAIISVILLILIVSAFFGPSLIINNLVGIKDTLIKPATSRLIQTVAENRQPYFEEWAGSFGPHVKNIDLTFWLFFLGSVYLFYHMIHVFKKKERIVLVLAYIALLSGVVFSRYSASSNLNGENFLSLFVYAAGFIIFIAAIGFYYYKSYRNGEEEKLKSISLDLMLLFTFFFLCIVAARAAVRTIMMLGPPVAIIISYFAVTSFNNAKKIKDETLKIISLGLAILVIASTLFAGYTFYNAVKSEASQYAPSIYTQQWQKAMAWVRENTSEDAVFGHWWDYGYWLQSIGERATVLDGGNAISYWNHLMGRYALTGPSNKEALEFLYAHNTTHFLIDSSDIGKYGAFSSIGSDVNYDRASYIPTFLRDPNQVQEKKNSTVFVYTGGVGLDGDLIYDDNGTQIFLPAGKAGLGAILVERNSSGKISNQPRGIFVYQNKQYNLPLRYAFDNEFMDFGSGIEAGFFLYPRAISQGNGQIQIDKYGAMLYLSNRTVKSQLARLYLYKENNTNFELVHSEDDFFVAQIKAQNSGFDSDFIEYQGLRGPIRIWEIHYPKDISLREEFLTTDYPEDILYAK